MIWTQVSFAVLHGALLCSQRVPVNTVREKTNVKHHLSQVRDRKTKTQTHQKWIFAAVFMIRLASSRHVIIGQTNSLSSKGASRATTCAYVNLKQKLTY